MYIPKPYFSNVPQFGNLDLDYIFMEDGIPMLFTCRSGSKIYLCVCRTLTPEQKWVISEISIEILDEMVEQKISINCAFKKFNRKSAIVKWHKGSAKEVCSVFPTVDLHDSDLPDPSLYLDEDDAADARCYIEGLQVENAMRSMLAIERQIDMDGDLDKLPASIYHSEQVCRISVDYQNIPNVENDEYNPVKVEMHTYCTENIVRNEKLNNISLPSNYDNNSEFVSDIIEAA